MKEKRKEYFDLGERLAEDLLPRLTKQLSHVSNKVEKSRQKLKETKSFKEEDEILFAIQELEKPLTELKYICQAIQINKAKYN